MSLKKHIKEQARSHGADLVAVAGPEVYTGYLDEVRNRLKETGATGDDYMLGADAESFFGQLSDARNALPEVRSLREHPLPEMRRNADIALRNAGAAPRR